MIRKVMKENITFGWFWPLLKFFLFEWRFADWPWNVVILLGFQVPVPFFDLIFGICDTCRCEITWTLVSDSSLVFAFFREKHCVLFSVLRILPEWRWSIFLFAFVFPIVLIRLVQKRIEQQLRKLGWNWKFEQNIFGWHCSKFLWN